MGKIPEVPKRPPKMKYTELPLYETPHSTYRTYEIDKVKCPAAYDKVLHNWLLPHVKSSRKSACDTWRDFSSEFKSMKKEIVSSLNDQKIRFKKYMRHPDNIILRQAVVAAGGVTGYYFNSKKGGGILSGLFWIGTGLLMTGSLCFPRETDEAFRNYTFIAAKMVIKAYNIICCKGVALGEKVPCKTDLPAGVKLDNEDELLKRCREKGYGEDSTCR